MNEEKLTVSELKLIAAKVCHLITIDPDFRMAIESMLRSNAEKLATVKFPETSDIETQY